jgi:rSAM/selenodomain-associated transferase 2
MIFAQDSSILVVFCRRPAHGVGKQRVAAELGAQSAFELSGLLLATTIEDALGWTGPVVISPASSADTEWARELIADADVVAQTEGNLGQRLTAVDQQIRAAGGRRIVYIGSDAPALTPALLAEAATCLQTTDAVFIPARDGGVTLMGAAKPWPDLTALAWGTEMLGDELQRCCEVQGFSTHSLTMSFDIDLRQDIADAPLLLQDDSRPARRQLLQWIDAQGLGQTGFEPGSISIVIPVYRDPAVLEQLLTRLQTMRPAASEVIVVDGDSNGSQGCAAVCAAHDVRHIAAAPCRGKQLRLGAANAHGEILWFLHADSEPPAHAIELIRDHINKGHVGGYFRFRFQGKRSWYKSALAWCINMRARLGIPYGDQGLFAHREDYRCAEGFAATPLFEEVRLVQKLRQRGKFSSIKANIGVATRRWERDGWLRRSLHNRYLAIAYMLGVTPEKLVRSYDKQAGNT